MPNQKRSINDFCMQLLQDKAFLRREYQSFVENSYGIDGVQGTVDGEILNRLIRKAKWNRKIRIFLTDILLYADSASMTHENFTRLLRFRGRIGVTYWSAMGHLNLPYYQLMELNRRPLSLEAFFGLFDAVCRYDCFLEGDMEQILRENRDLTELALQGCIADAKERYGDSKKLRAAMNGRTGRSHRRKRMQKSGRKCGPY